MPFFIMVLETESHYKYRTLALNVLAKKLDDICPKFEGEPSNIRENLIKERAQFFNEQEKLIDKEWQTLEKEAQREVNNLKKERLLVIKKIEKTRKAPRIKLKIQHLTRNKNKKIKYLKDKLKNETLRLEKKLKTLNPESKKYIQIQNKLTNFTTDVNQKIESVTKRYDKILENTRNSDNSESVKLRVEQSHNIWERKFEKLKQQFEEKEIIHENKRFEFDQIRVAVEDSLKTNVVSLSKTKIILIPHWCLVAGVPLKMYYQEVKNRLTLLGRNSLEINELIENL